MSRMQFLGVRVPGEDLEALRRRARELGFSRSQLVRLLLEEGLRRFREASSPPQEMTSRLSALEERLAMMEVAIRAAVRTLEMVSSWISETGRIPSFLEYRARLVAQGATPRPDESPTDFFLRALESYFYAYGVVPDPSKPSFGDIPAEVDAEKVHARIRELSEQVAQRERARTGLM